MGMGAENVVDSLVFVDHVHVGTSLAVHLQVRATAHFMVVGVAVGAHDLPSVVQHGERCWGRWTSGWLRRRRLVPCATRVLPIRILLSLGSTPTFPRVLKLAECAKLAISSLPASAFILFGCSVLNGESVVFCMLAATFCELF